MKITIAICDDEIKICSHIEKILLDILANKSIEADIDVFFSAEELCREIEHQKYDMVFLDIELPEMNGVELGNYIREIKNDNTTQIVYISSSQKYAMELFAVRPMDFLVKPLNQEKIERVLNVFLKIKGRMDFVFYYKKRHTSQKIEIYKIMYFVRENKKVRLVTTEGTETFYESLESIYEQLKNHGFLFIHKSYIVNHQYIKVIQYDSVTMTDNETFSISQQRRKEIREQYFRLEAI